MISLKMSTTAAIMTLLMLPVAMPTASFAENPPGHHGTSSTGARAGGQPYAPRFSGPSRFFNGGVVSGGVRVAGAPATQTAPSGGNWRGGTGWRGNEGWRGGERREHRDRDRFVPGFVTGVVIGGVLASQNYGPVYDAPGYADDQYYNDGNAPAPVADDSVAYCIQNFSSYDPATGTYLGNDGLQHPCP